MISLKEGGDTVSNNSYSEITPLFISINKVAEIMGVSKSTAFNLAKNPDFPAIRVGTKRIVVPYEKFQEWINRQVEKPIEVYRVR